MTTSTSKASKQLRTHVRWEIMRDASICEDHDQFSGYQSRALNFPHSIEEAEREAVEDMEVGMKRWYKGMI